MSPTSYQAAPPRTTTISDARASVKLAQTRANFRRLRTNRAWRNYLCEREKTTTGCKGLVRTVRSEESSNEHPPCPNRPDRGSAPHYQTAAPSPLARSWDPPELAEGNPLAPY